MSEEQRSTVSRKVHRQHHVHVGLLLPHVLQRPLLDFGDVLHRREKAHVGDLAGLSLLVDEITR